MIIGIDIDEVLADFLSAFIAFHNEIYGTSFQREQWFSYRFREVLGVEEKEAIQRVYAFHESHYFANILPVADVVEGVQRLKQDHDLFAITGRQEYLAEKTNEWLKHYFPQIFKAVHFANHYSHSGRSREKSEICSDGGVEVLVEDNLEYALQCASPRRRVLLLDQPWNQGDLPLEIVRVYSWREIVEQIMKMQNPL